jgi:hypothetical protein
MKPPSNGKVIPIGICAARETAEGFRRLAEAAERGEIVGAGYTVIDARGQTREGALGQARTNLSLAHYGASRLAALLLWAEDAAGKLRGR